MQSFHLVDIRAEVSVQRQERATNATLFEKLPILSTTIADADHPHARLVAMQEVARALAELVAEQDPRILLGFEVSALPHSLPTAGLSPPTNCLT